MHPHVRAERLIVVGRVVLAGASFAAIALDRDASAAAGRAFTLLAAYFGYAAALLLVVWTGRAPTRRWQLTTHVIDLVVFTTVMYLTEGPVSPYFVYFVFAVVVATVRWRWRGALWTSLIVIVVFVGFGLYVARVLRDPTFELDRFLVRSAYLGVVAMLLGYLGAYQERLQRELSQLALWPAPPAEGPARVAQQMAEYLARTLRARGLAIAWYEDEEPWLNLAECRAGAPAASREPPGTLGALCAPDLASVAFLCNDLRSPDPRIAFAAADGLHEWRGQPLDPLIQARYDARTVVSWPLGGDAFEGRLFAFEKRDLTLDDLVIGQIVADIASARLGHALLMQRLRNVAAVEERVRFARDLHDGLLQSLTAAALHLKTASMVAPEGADAVREQIARVQDLIASEQHDLRLLIDEIRGEGEPGVYFELGTALERLRGRAAREWALEVELQVSKSGVPSRLRADVFRLVQEGIVNAARHARARRVRVDVLGDADAVRVVIENDGAGYPFHGEFDETELAREGRGPASIRARVRALGGTLRLRSSNAGSQLAIRLPIARGE